MAVICPDQRLLFVMVPGTGCSAIGTILREQFGGRWIPERPVFRSGRKVIDSKHCSVKELAEQGLLTKAELARLIKFATIRNPFDRFATDYAREAGSWLEDHLSNPRSFVNAGPHELVAKRRKEIERRIREAREMTFEDWLLRRLELSSLRDPVKVLGRLRRRLTRPSRRATLFPLVDGVDHLLHYETLEADFNRVLQTAGVDKFVPIPGKNVTPQKKPYRDYYSPRLRGILQREFASEFEEFGYSF